MHTFPAFKSDLLQVALEQSFNAVMITNAERGGGGPVIVYCNAALCAMTGYSEAELLGRPAHAARAGDRPGGAGQAAPLPGAGPVLRRAAINYRKNGEAYHLEWNTRRYAMGPERSAILSRYSAMSRSGCRRTKSAICWRRP
jgi:PAS domain S-box-containing protein